MLMEECGMHNVNINVQQKDDDDDYCSSTYGKEG